MTNSKINKHFSGGIGNLEGGGWAGRLASAALLQVSGQEQPRGQEVQMPIADFHLSLALQVGTCKR